MSRSNIVRQFWGAEIGVAQMLGIKAVGKGQGTINNFGAIWSRLVRLQAFRQKKISAPIRTRFFAYFLSFLW